MAEDNLSEKIKSQTAIAAVLDSIGVEPKPAMSESASATAKRSAEARAMREDAKRRHEERLERQAEEAEEADRAAAAERSAADVEIAAGLRAHARRLRAQAKTKAAAEE